jgi:hypothetical protein
MNEAALQDLSWLSFVKEWDETKHPRHPAGSPDGGKFAAGYSEGEYSPEQRNWLKELARDQKDAERTGKVPQGVRIDTKMDRPAVKDEDAKMFLSVYKEFEDSNAARMGTKYGGLHSMILAEGKVMNSPESPPPIKLGTPKECFRNSTLMALENAHQDWHYAEGYVFQPEVPIAIHHAWIWDEKNQHVIDPTIGWSPKAKYIGLSYSSKGMQEAMRGNRFYGLYRQGHDYTDLMLRGGR